MKLLTTIICFAVFAPTSMLAQIEDKSSTSVSKASLQSWSFPIDEQTDKTLKLFMRYEKCSLTVFFKRNGIVFPEGSKCSLNSKKNVVDVFNTHQNASILMSMLGKIMLELSGEMTPEKLLKKIKTQDDNNVSCFPSQRKPRHKE